MSMLRKMLISSMGMCMSRKVKTMPATISTPMTMSLVKERQVSAVPQCLCHSYPKPHLTQNAPVPATQRMLQRTSSHVWGR